MVPEWVWGLRHGPRFADSQCNSMDATLYGFRS